MGLSQGTAATRWAAAWNELDAGSAALMQAAEAASFFSSRLWFEVLCDTTLDGGDRTALLVDDQLVLPLRETPARALRPRRLGSLANFYSCGFAPLSDGAVRPDAVERLARGLRARRPGIDVVDLHSLSCPGHDYAAIEQGFRAAGWWLQRYFHFGNWYEPTAGITADAYLAARPAQLRNTLRRKEAALARRNAIRYEMITDGPELERAIRDYETVYAASWKHAEPYPAFAATLMRRAAAAGALRLGLMHVAGEPAAGQIWIVWHGRATIFKLAHDERFKELSLGSLLTWRMMRHVLDQDHVAEVDFGRGDDPYKQSWLSRRRERRGLMAFNPARPLGLAQAARHIGGRWVKQQVCRVLGKAPSA